MFFSEWERLFGYTQSELRMMTIKEGARKMIARLSLFDPKNNPFTHGAEALLSGLVRERTERDILHQIEIGHRVSSHCTHLSTLSFIPFPLLLVPFRTTIVCTVS